MEPGSIRSWLYRIVHGIAVDDVRRKTLRERAEEVRLDVPEVLHDASRLERPLGRLRTIRALSSRQGAVAQDIVRRESRSLLQYVSEAFPWTTREERAALATLQEMIEDGVEFILGMTYDETFGPLVVCGAGGVTVEVATGGGS